MYAIMAEESKKAATSASSSSSGQEPTTKDLLSSGGQQVLRMLLKKFFALIAAQTTWTGLEEHLGTLPKRKILSMFEMAGPKEAAKLKKRQTHTSKAGMASALAEELRDRVYQTKA